VDISSFPAVELDSLNRLLVSKIDQLKPEFENSDDEFFFNKVAKAYLYDYETLKEDHLQIQRMGETDYVKFSFKSESPELSAFAASKFSQSFIEYFESLRRGENNETIAYLGETAKQKKQVLTEKQNALEDYKRQGKLVALEAQREATVNQIKELEQERNEAIRDINASEKTIADLDKLMLQVKPVSVDNEEIKEDPKALLTNKKILNLRKQERELTNNLIDGVGNRRQTESRLKAVKKALETEMKALSAQYKEKELLKPENKDNTLSNELFEKQVDANITLTNAQEQKNIIDNKLIDLQRRSRSYVSAEAYVLNLEREIEIAKTEYEDLVKELNKEELSTNRDESPLTIIEHAQLPEKAESDKKLLFTAFSGVVGASLATFFIFLLAFLDNTLHSPNQFKLFTGLPLLGAITKIKLKNLDLQVLFSANSGKRNQEQFKELIRNLRFNLEISGNGKIYLFTSPRENEGKSFLITILAHSLVFKQKRVLVIDTNFKNNTLSRWGASSVYNSQIFQEVLNRDGLGKYFILRKLNTPFNNTRIELIANTGKNQSPLEGLNPNAFHQFLTRLSGMYDYILMEGAALNDYADTKELIELSDQVVGVFSADSTLRQPDKNSVTYLKELGDKYLGSVLNRVNPKNLN